MSSAPTNHPPTHCDDDEPIATAHGLARVTLKKKEGDKGTPVFLKGDRLGNLFLLFKGCIVTPTVNNCYYAATNSREQMDEIYAFLEQDLKEIGQVAFQPYGIELHTYTKPCMRPHPTAADTVIVDPSELTTSVDKFRNAIIGEMDKIYQDNLKLLREGDNAFRRAELSKLMEYMQNRRMKFIECWQRSA